MGKFDNKSYTNSSGLNGVGLSCINALSYELDIEVTRNFKTMGATFEKGLLTEKLHLKNAKEEFESGTMISFKPDLEIFMLEALEIQIEELNEYFEQLSFLNKGITFNVIDADSDKQYSFLSKNGIYDYLNKLTDKKELLKSNVALSFANENMSIDIVFNYTNNDDEVIRAYCNSIWNKDGGTHVAGFKMGLIFAIKKYIEQNSLIPKKASITIDDIDGSDVREGLVTILDLKHSNPLYASQTKHQVTNKDVRGFVQSSMNEQFLEWLNGNPNLAKIIANKVINNAMSKREVKVIKDKRKSKSVLLSSKLSDCTAHGEESELWITEGK